MARLSPHSMGVCVYVCMLLQHIVGFCYVYIHKALIEVVIGCAGAARAFVRHLIGPQI